MSANPDTAAPTGRHKPAQGKERSDAALGHGSQSTASPEVAKEGGELPNGWRWVNLPDIGELSRGKSKHRPRNEPKLYGGPHPFIQTGDIRESGGTIRKHSQTYSELGLSQSKLWPTGTLCITIAANIGETGILSYPACFPDSVVGFRHDGDPATVRFIELYFRIAKAELERLAPATAQKNINVDILSKLQVPLPPLPEQRRIVAEIEKQFTRLEAGVAALRRVQANLKRYRAAVLKAACEGRLVPTEAALQSGSGVPPLGSGKKRQDAASTFETGEALLARILTERRQKWQGRGQYKEPVAPDSAKFPPLPDGWTWCMSDAVFSFITSGSRGWAEYYSDTGPIFLRIGNLDHENIRLDLTELQHVAPPSGAEGVRTVVQPNDILISITADVGMVGLVPEGLGEAYINQHVALARPLPSICPSYVAYYLCASEGGWGHLKKLQRGATKVGLGLDDIRAVPVPLPPLAEQTRIVAEVERRLSVV